MTAPFFDDLVSRSSASTRDNNLRPESSPESSPRSQPVFGVAPWRRDDDRRQFDPSDRRVRRSLCWPVTRGPGARPDAVSALRRRDGRRRLRERRGRASDGAHLPPYRGYWPCKWSDVAGLRLLRIRQAFASVVLAHLQAWESESMRRSGSASMQRLARSIGRGSTSTDRLWQRGIRSRRQAGGSSLSWRSNCRRRRRPLGKPVRGLISICGPVARASRRFWRACNESFGPSITRIAPCCRQTPTRRQHGALPVFGLDISSATVRSRTRSPACRVWHRTVGVRIAITNNNCPAPRDNLSRRAGQLLWV